MRIKILILVTVMFMSGASEPLMGCAGCQKQGYLFKLPKKKKTAPVKETAETSETKAAPQESVGTRLRRQRNETATRERGVRIITDIYQQ